MSKSPRRERTSEDFARPSMPALDALDREHRQVIEALAETHELVDKLESQGVTPATRALARKVCTFFTTHARNHHAAEERLIFPGLIKNGSPELVQHVVRLQQDHGWLEEDWLELEPQLEAVVNGFTWYDIDMLRAALPVFEQLYRDHIALEESLIYPEARRRQMADDSAREARTSVS